MPKQAKKLKDIQPGDTYLVPKVINKVTQTVNGWELTFDDNTTMNFDKSMDPAIEVDSR